ncbi:hypothetical protein H696_06300 [Fonticula alba]|uniref:Uncharacterized protein n=1 Tax=Fonticula alba TaxID=691883 RepID=A0A058Z008_FONAL|nr:hypothetical protein H696_06300 [Fonticula alba]KCV67278.1 hypothetical protein H696_06300 [Fonticula alba]|eukprot:XP_009498318.1 hypothetical protein H696_06300 [Fonticula alba]
MSSQREPSSREDARPSGRRDVRSPDRGEGRRSRRRSRRSPSPDSDLDSCSSSRSRSRSGDRSRSRSRSRSSRRRDRRRRRRSSSRSRRRRSSSGSDRLPATDPVDLAVRFVENQDMAEGHINATTLDSRVKLDPERDYNALSRTLLPVWMMRDCHPERDARLAGLESLKPFARHTDTRDPHNPDGQLGGIYFYDLPAGHSQALFRVFVDKWNQGQLPLLYYFLSDQGITEARRRRREMRAQAAAQ